MNKDDVKIFFMIVFVAVYMLTILLMVKTPYIMLPKSFQHNNIGELPVFEMMDDGDFYEKDGDEYIDNGSWIDRCTEAVSSSCNFFDKDKRERRKIVKKHKKCIKIKKDWCDPIPKFKNKNSCIKKSTSICSESNRAPQCDELFKFGLGLFTCWGAYE